jgi:hypothetical protein
MLILGYVVSSILTLTIVVSSSWAVNFFTEEANYRSGSSRLRRSRQCQEKDTGKDAESANISRDLLFDVGYCAERYVQRRPLAMQQLSLVLSLSFRLKPRSYRT